MDIVQANSFPGKYPSDQPRIQASEDPQTKSEQNIFKNTQKILGDGFYLIFEKYLQEKASA